jgi:hypothetical protein
MRFFKIKNLFIEEIKKATFRDCTKLLLETVENLLSSKSKSY